MKTERLEKIDFIKTTMIILVIFYHSMLFYNGNWFEYIMPVDNAIFLKYISAWMNTFHVQALCMSSGYLFYYFYKEFGKYNNPKKDILKRVKRLIIPYIFTSLFWVVPISIYFFKYSVVDIIKNFILIVNPNQLWFIIMLFMVFCFFELFGKKIKLSLRNLIIMYIMCTSLNFILSYLNFDYFQFRRAIQYMLYFYFGGYLLKKKDAITFKQILLIIIISIILYMLYITLSGMDNKLIHYITMYMLPVISVLEVTLIYYFSTNIKLDFIIKNKVYLVLKENSFGMYLFHQQIIYICIVLLNGVVCPIALVIICFIASSILSLIITLLLKKNKCLKEMFGL